MLSRTHWSDTPGACVSPGALTRRKCWTGSKHMAQWAVTVFSPLSCWQVQLQLFYVAAACSLYMCMQRDILDWSLGDTFSVMLHSTAILRQCIKFVSGPGWWSSQDVCICKYGCLILAQSYFHTEPAAGINGRLEMKKQRFHIHILIAVFSESIVDGQTKPAAQPTKTPQHSYWFPLAPSFSQQHSRPLQQSHRAPQQHCRCLQQCHRASQRLCRCLQQSHRLPQQHCRSLQQSTASLLISAAMPLSPPAMPQSTVATLQMPAVKPQSSTATLHLSTIKPQSFTATLQMSATKLYSLIADLHDKAASHKGIAKRCPQHCCRFPWHCHDLYSHQC